MMYILFLTLSVLNIFGNINGLTETISTYNCFSIPNSPFTIVGAKIVSAAEKGTKVCYYAAKTSEYYLYIKINQLNLQKVGNICPKFKLEAYKSVRVEQETEVDIIISFHVPENPRLLFEANCTNYEKLQNTLFSTHAPGDQIILTYDPQNTVSPANAYEITLSSYLIGQSYSCPDDSYLCWSSNHICIDKSLMCDNSDNCYDNSDENAYQCTGRIGNIPMPLFIIIIIGCIIFLIFIIMVIILLMRNRHQSKEKDRRRWNDESMLEPSYMG